MLASEVIPEKECGDDDNRSDADENPSEYTESEIDNSDLEDEYEE